MSEMPLVLFTILSQLAVGGFITLWFFERKGSISERPAFLLSLSLFILSIGAVLASLFHLGHPFEAYRALANFGDSWLSREVTFFAIFILLLLLYTIGWWRHKPGLRKMAAPFTAIFGLATLLSSALIYTIPAVPAWDNAYPTFSFLLSAVMLGPLFTGVMADWLNKDSNFALRSKPVLVTVLIGMVGALFLFPLYLTSILSGKPEAAMTGWMIATDLIFWLRVVCFFAASLLMIRSQLFKNQRAVFSVAFLLLLMSELIGRVLFYETAVHL